MRRRRRSTFRLSRWHQRADSSRERRIQTVEENGQRPLALPVLLCLSKRLLQPSRPYFPARTIACPVANPLSDRSIVSLPSMEHATAHRAVLGRSPRGGSARSGHSYGPDRQTADAPASRSENCLAQRRTNRRNRKLARAGRNLLARYHVDFYRGHSIDSQYPIVVEVRLLDASAVDRVLSPEGRP